MGKGSVNPMEEYRRAAKKREARKHEAARAAVRRGKDIALRSSSDEDIAALHASIDALKKKISASAAGGGGRGGGTTRWREELKAAQAALAVARRTKEDLAARQAYAKEHGLPPPTDGRERREKKDKGRSLQEEMAEMAREKARLEAELEAKRGGGGGGGAYPEAPIVLSKEVKATDFVPAALRRKLAAKAKGKGKGKTAPPPPSTAPPPPPPPSTAPPPPPPAAAASAEADVDDFYASMRKIGAL